MPYDAPPSSPGGAWRGETYYGLPALKASPWDWKVSAYIFIAGLAGSAQIIATAADLFGGARARGVVSRGRHLALLAPAVGGPLLIADLHTPQRFYNMFRIFRGTSPMSIGTYVLSGFSLFSIATVAGQFLADRSGARRGSLPARAATAAQLPAALAGAGMSTYTAALLSATSTPLWAAVPQPLAARFGCSSMATAAASLSLAERIDGGPEENCRDLDRLAMLALAGEAVATVACERRWRAAGIAGPDEGNALHALGAALGIALPLACHAANAARRRRSLGLSVLASLGVLAGGALMRHAVLKAGNRSAERPADYFRFASPRSAERGGDTAPRARGGGWQVRRVERAMPQPAAARAGAPAPIPEEQRR